MVGLESLSDIWGYTGRATHVWQAQSERPERVSRGSLPGRVCSSYVTVQVNTRWHTSGKGPHLFKKGQAEVSTMGGARDTMCLAPEVTEGAGGVFSEIWHSVPR